MGRNPQRQSPGQWCWTTPDLTGDPALRRPKKKSAFSTSRVTGTLVLLFVGLFVVAGVFLFVKMWGDGVVKSASVAADAAQAADAARNGGSVQFADPTGSAGAPGFDPMGAKALAGIAQARIAELTYYAEFGTFTTDTEMLGVPDGVSIAVCGHSGFVVRAGGTSAYVYVEGVQPLTWYQAGAASCPSGDPEASGWSTAAPMP